MFERRIKNATQYGPMRSGVYEGKYGMKATRAEFDALKKELEAAGYKDVMFQSNPYNRYTVFFKDSSKKFTDSELRKLIKLADAVEEKQEYRLGLNKAREYVKGMKDITDKIQELRSKYAQLHREFNKLRLLMLPSKVDENTLKEFRALVAEKQEYDARSWR